ncbi:hypothetical protein SH2C18_16810 [Clostridium sediminicola]|uniref:hypothetical protein n=1 Tax=Clostridium sediminicola TaxID=3114879 RepID=UPI0031F2581D
MGIIFIILLGFFIWYLIKDEKICLNSNTNINKIEDPSISILKMKLAKGEIDIEEFEIKKRMIEN